MNLWKILKTPVLPSGLDGWVYLVSGLTLLALVGSLFIPYAMSDPLVENQQHLISILRVKHNLMDVRVTSAQDVAVAYKAGMSDGKAVAAAGLKPVIVERLVTEKASAPGPKDVGDVVVSTVVKAGLVQETSGGLLVHGTDTVTVILPKFRWTHVYTLPFTTKAGSQVSVSEDFKVPGVTPTIASGGPVETTVVRHWHWGKAVGCGGGVSTTILAWPSLGAGVGPSLNCGMVWGMVK